MQQRTKKAKHKEKKKPKKEKTKKQKKTKKKDEILEEIVGEPVDDGYDDVIPPDTDRVKEGWTKNSSRGSLLFPQALFSSFPCVL